MQQEEPLEEPKSPVVVPKEAEVKPKTHESKLSDSQTRKISAVSSYYKQSDDGSSEDIFAKDQSPAR